MELKTAGNVAARVAYLLKRGDETFALESGKRLRVQKFAPGAVDVLDVTVPAGKDWTITMTIQIEERDA